MCCQGEEVQVWKKVAEEESSRLESERRNNFKEQTFFLPLQPKGMECKHSELLANFSGMELVPLSKKFATFSIHKSVLHLSVKKLGEKIKNSGKLSKCGKIDRKKKVEKRTGRKEKSGKRDRKKNVRNTNHDEIIGLEGSNWEEINGCHFNE